MAARDQRIVQAFGKVLRELRERQDWTQEELAHACEFDRTYISLIERAKRQPSLTTLFALSEQLGVEPDEIVRRTKSLAERRK